MIFFGIAAILLVVMIIDLASSDDERSPSKLSQALQEVNQSNQVQQETELTQQQLTRPLDLRVTATTTTLRVTWAQSPDASAYRIETDDFEDTTSRPSYNITDLEPNTAYVIRVRAESTDQSSGWSFIATRTKPLAQIEGVSYRASRDSLNIQWRNVAGAKVYRIRSGSIDTTTTSTSFTIRNLNPGTTYRFEIRAESNGHSSEWYAAKMTTEPPPELPPNVRYHINERYDDVDPILLERALAEVVEWYKQQYGLVAATASLIAVEPQCNPTPYSEALGFARRVVQNGEPLIEVCVRLDEDSDSAVEAEEFRWLVAHEFFHVLQANAGWAFEDSDSIFGIQGECGRFLTEGSAEYFGQLYAWGELQGGGILDALAALFGGDVERWYYYEEGARAFEALIHWKGREAATHFWESEEARCADAFLTTFDVVPGKYETDWKELTSQ